jgi:hypothetical protein
MIDSTKQARIFPIAKLDLRDIIFKNNLPLTIVIYFGVERVKTRILNIFLHCGISCRQGGILVRVFHNCNEMYVFTDFTAVLSSMTMCGNLVQHRSTNYDSYTPQCKTILSILLLASDPLCMNASTSYRMNTDAILCQCTMKQDIMYKASLPTC